MLLIESDPIIEEHWYPLEQKSPPNQKTNLRLRKGWYFEPEATDREGKIASEAEKEEQKKLANEKGL